MTDLILCACLTNQFCLMVIRWSCFCLMVIRWSCSTSGAVSCLLEIKFRVSTGRVSQHRLPCPFSLCVHREADGRTPPGRTELRLLGLSLGAYVNITVSQCFPRDRMEHCLAGCPQSPSKCGWATCARVRRPSSCTSPLSHTLKPVIFKQRVVISLQLLQVLHKYEQIL